MCVTQVCIPQRGTAAGLGRPAADPLTHTAPVAAAHHLPAAATSAPAAPAAFGGGRGSSSRRSIAGDSRGTTDVPCLETPFSMHHPLAQPSAPLDAQTFPSRAQPPCTQCCDDVQQGARSDDSCLGHLIAVEVLASWRYSTSSASLQFRPVCAGDSPSGVGGGSSAGTGTATGSSAPATPATPPAARSGGGRGGTGLHYGGSADSSCSTSFAMAGSPQLPFAVTPSCSHSLASLASAEHQARPKHGGSFSTPVTIAAD